TATARSGGPGCRSTGRARSPPPVSPAAPARPGRGLAGRPPAGREYRPAAAGIFGGVVPPCPSSPFRASLRMPKSVVSQGAEVVAMDAGLGAFASADILIEDGAIKAVGPSLHAPAGAARIDGAGMIALPGIIDAHTCLWQTVLRGYVPDLWPGT